MLSYSNLFSVNVLLSLWTTKMASEHRWLLLYWHCEIITVPPTIELTSVYICGSWPNLEWLRKNNWPVVRFKRKAKVGDWQHENCVRIRRRGKLDQMMSTRIGSVVACPGEDAQIIKKRKKTRNFKIGQYLANISSRIWFLTFLTHHVEWLTLVTWTVSRVFLPRDALVHSAVLRLHVVRPSVRPSVRLWRWWIRIT